MVSTSTGRPSRCRDDVQERTFAASTPPGPNSVALSGPPQRRRMWSAMKDRLESGSCSRLGMSERIGSRSVRPEERQAVRRERGVDHRAVEVRERMVVDAADLADGRAAAAEGLDGGLGGQLQSFECSGRHWRHLAPVGHRGRREAPPLAQVAVGRDALELEGEGGERAAPRTSRVETRGIGRNGRCGPGSRGGLCHGLFC